MSERPRPPLPGSAEFTAEQMANLALLIPSVYRASVLLGELLTFAPWPVLLPKPDEVP